MLQVSSHVHFGFWLIYFLLWVFPCLQVTQVFICLWAVQVQWFPGEHRQRHHLEHTWGCSRSSVHGLAYPWRHQVVRRQGHQDMTTTASQREASWTIVEDNIPNATNARGGLLIARRWNKVASSSRYIDDESNFGDFGYEVTVWHEDHVKVEDRAKKELCVLKQQLRKNMKLHRQTNELQ